MSEVTLYQLEQELTHLGIVGYNCPARPCHNCYRRFDCISLQVFKQTHPEYDEKCALYERLRRAVLEEAKEQTCSKVGVCEHVPQHESHRSQMTSTLSMGNKKKGDIYMKLDFSEVQELNSKISEVGDHVFTIKAAKEARSVNGTNQLVVDMVDENEGFVRDYINLEGAGAFKMKQFLKSLDISEEDAAGMEASDFVGLEVEARIEMREYEGTERANVKKYL